MPCSGCSRQGRKAAPREPITAKPVADVLATAGIGRAVTVDPHEPAIQRFFNIPVDHLTAPDSICEYLKFQGISGFGCLLRVGFARRAAVL